MVAKRKWKGLALAVLALCPLSFYAAAQTNHTDPVIIEELLAGHDAGEHNDVDTDIAPVDDDRLDEVMAVYAADADLQTERPEWEPEPIEFRQRREPNGFLRAIAAFFQAIGPLLGYVMLILVTVAILAALYFIFGESLSLRLRQKPSKAAPNVSNIHDMRPEEKKAIALLEDADALAAAGRFAEAVHFLLFRSIDDIQEKKQGTVPRSLTAREIGTLDTLPGRVRDGLSPIIRIVERSFFGGRDVDEDSWKTARASYQDFAFGEAWA